MKLRGWFLVAGVMAANAALGQRASSWRAYKLADGMPESACVSVSVAGQGKVLARQLNLSTVTQVDGYKIEPFSSAERGSSRVYASPGGQLWAVVPEGLQELRDSNSVVHPVPEIAGELRAGVANPIDPIPLCPVKQGQVIFLLSDRLMKLNLEDPERAVTELICPVSRTRLERFSALAVARNGGLWIAGARGLAKAGGPARSIRAETEWVEHLAPESLQIRQFVAMHEDEEGRVTAVATSRADERMVVLFDGKDWQALPVGPGRLRQAWRGPEGSLWATTIDTLLQWRGGAWVENDEISARQYFDVAVEPGGIFWLATSDGLFRYSPQMWRRPSGPGAVSLAIQALATDKGGVWFLAGNTLHYLQEGEHKEFVVPPGLQTTTVRTLDVLKNGDVFLGADQEALQFEPSSGRFKGVKAPGAVSGLRAIGSFRDQTLCLQVLNLKESVPRLLTYDGGTFARYADAPSEWPIGRELSALYAAPSGDVWLSGELGTAVYHDRKWRSFVAPDKSVPEAAVAFAEMPDGRIWCCTLDMVWEFDGKSWATIKGGFDRISDLLRARDGSVWVASNAGVHRFSQGAWLENSVEEGLPGAGIHQLCEDQRGKIWAATPRGLSVYHPEADQDPPQTTIVELPGREKNLGHGETLTVSFRGQDKWKYTARERLLYSYRLDDREWSPYQESTVATFPDLSAGKHYFQVRAMDRNFNRDLKGTSAEIMVVLPWYRETRLMLIAVSGLGAALFFAALAFNRHRQLLRSYTEVERKVAQRTRELELANRELLHSQKMNALGTLAAGIAHDFNNILSIIKGSAQIIEDNVGEPKKILTRTDRIKTVVEQGAGIVKAMLGFSRDSEDGAGICDVNLVVEETLRLLGDRFLREVEVRFEPAEGLPAVPCAKDFLQQILLNFIFNAAEAMNGNRQIIVSTREARELPADLALKPAVSREYLMIAVQDFGCGIAPEHRTRIFEPFFTTKALSARRGTGLGLSMAYQLATKMEAGLAVESVVQQGSTFTVILPVPEQKETDPAKAP